MPGFRASIRHPRMQLSQSLPWKLPSDSSSNNGSNNSKISPFLIPDDSSEFMGDLCSIPTTDTTTTTSVSKDTNSSSLTSVQKQQQKDVEQAVKQASLEDTSTSNSGVDMTELFSAYEDITEVVSSLSSSQPTKVLVAGASGRTGQLVMELLLKDSRYEAKALVRSTGSAKKLRKAIPTIGLDQIVVCDVTTLNTNITSSTLPPGLNTCQDGKLIICTSAVPTISKLSLIRAFLRIPINLIQRKKAIDFRSFRFVWKNGQYPEKVDYHGQIAQIDMAKRLGMKRVIVVGSMGGTDPNNFLNSVGKDKKGSGNGDILLWKRRAERYLVNSGIPYTVIHPGGLTDSPPGKEDFVLDVDDKLLANKKRSISRGDVASLCVASLALPDSTRVAFDCITRPVEDDNTKKVVKTAYEALRAFLNEAKSYNYAL